MRHVYFVLAPKILLLDFAGPAEAFAYAAKAGADVRLHFVSATPSLASGIGLSLSGLEPLPPSLPDDALVFVCGSMGSEQAYRSNEAKATVRWLRETVTERHQLACVCSGALLAGWAGLLDGRACTTHHDLIARLAALAPRARVLEDRVFVRDGNVATSAGVTAGLDLALQLLEDGFGAAVAQQVARELVVWMRRTGSDPQLSPWLAFRNHLHPVVHQVQDAISRAPAENVSLEGLARKSHTSVRNLTRLFRQHAGTSIVEYQQRLRIAQARQLLENPRLSVEDVAARVGFGSARALRRVMAKLDQGLPSRVRLRA
jgi:transcriptional regulator GlxA family with amidase domain